MLELCRQLFSQLNAAPIRYCHWKSNSHLANALDGETDLDLLVAREDKAAFLAVLEKLPIIAMRSPPSRSFPDMEDHLGFDESSGALIHLHVHYRLILGQRFIKNHVLPIDALFFSNRTLREGVSVPVPELELIVLLVRAAMKLGPTDIVAHAARTLLGRRGTPFPGPIEREFRLLIQSSRRERTLALLAASGLPLPAPMLLRFLRKLEENSFGALDFLALHSSVLWRFRSYRRQPFLRSFPRFCFHVISGQRFVKLLVPSLKKTVPGRGCSFAIVGADGSGKTTLAGDLRAWLTWKLAVGSHYYGIPKSWWVRGIAVLSRGARAFGAVFLAELFEAALWIAVARARVVVSDRIQSDNARGRVSIVDRFPLPAFGCMKCPMDGARLSGKASRPARWFARREADWYQAIRSPDFMLVLQAPVEVLRGRKTDLDYETHVEKARAVNALQPGAGVVTIDATQPYPRVLLEAKRMIWAHLMLHVKARA